MLQLVKLSIRISATISVKSAWVFIGLFRESISPVQTELFAFYHLKR